MATDILILTNFAGLLAVFFLLIATVKVILLSRNSDWDGWGLMSLSTALLATSIILGMFDKFGLYVANFREISSAAAGLVASLALIMSTSIIKKIGEEG